MQAYPDRRRTAHPDENDQRSASRTSETPEEPARPVDRRREALALSRDVVVDAWLEGKF